MIEKKKAFELEMFRIYKLAKSEANYNATIFFRMLNEQGGLMTAKYLINQLTPSDGYTELHLRGRLDLTVEAMIVGNSEWHDLFTSEEIEKAKKRLRDYKFKFHE